MAYARPTMTQLYQQALADILAESQTTSLLRRAILPAIAWALAGMAWLLYGFLDYISKQCTPFTSTGEFMYGWGALKNVTPLPAAFASCSSVQFSGTNGAPVVAGQITQRGDGVSYVVTSGGTIASNTVTVSIQAVVAGSAGNAPTGTGMTLLSPVTGVNAGGVTTAAVTGGADPETEAAYQTRMLQVYAAPPQGGSAVDYVEWAMAVPGVTRAWVAPNGAGAGTVIVYHMRDVTDAAYGGFPQGTNGVATNETRATAATGDQLGVANAIFPLRPVTALAYSYTPIAYPVNFTIANLEPNTAAIQAAITAELAGVFLRLGAPGGTTFPIMVQNAPNGEIYQSEFTSALNAIPGLRRYTMTSPSSPVIAPTGYLPELGTITFSS